MIRCNIITIVTFLRYLRLLRESRQENHSSPKKSTLKFDLIRTASNLNFVMGWVLQQQKNNQQTYLTTSLPRDQKKKNSLPEFKIHTQELHMMLRFPQGELFIEQWRRHSSSHASRSVNFYHYERENIGSTLCHMPAFALSTYASKHAVTIVYSD